MNREFKWVNILLWAVSILGGLIFLGCIGLMIWGVNILTNGASGDVSALDFVLIGTGAFLGLIIAAGMQGLRMGIALNTKAVLIMEQLELLDVRIRGAAPQNQQVKQLDALQDLIDVNREMLEKLDILEKTSGNLTKSMEGYRLEGSAPEIQHTSSIDPVTGEAMSTTKDDHKWRCPHCSTENPGYLFKCRECGREINT